MIKFRSTGKELEEIKSGKLKQIVREIDRWNPVFEEIEKLNGMFASRDIKSLKLIYIIGDSNCYEEQFKIKKISYKDGYVIIEWD